jgi:PleD family two-component response regulator
VASWKPGEAMDALIDRADQALYRSKREGRNRVTAGA